jgi:3'(2'),5'-bisphosphate nucleotidase
MSCTPAPLAQTLYEIAALGAEVIAPLRGEPLSFIDKPDGSFATNADVAAEAVILKSLALHFPDIPVIGEESCPDPIHPDVDRFFLVDPIDGTRGFARGSASYTINIGLIEHGVPTAGVILAPAKNRAFVAADGQAFERVGSSDWFPLRGASAPMGQRIGLASHSRDDLAADMLRSAGVAEIRPVSSSLKFGLLAAGEAHVYARGHMLMAWDIAAGDAIVRAAGGIVTDQNGQTLVYRSSVMKQLPFLAWGLRV